MANSSLYFEKLPQSDVVYCYYDYIDAWFKFMLFQIPDQSHSWFLNFDKKSNIIFHFGFSDCRTNLVLFMRSFLKDFKKLSNISLLLPSPRWTITIQNFVIYSIYTKDTRLLGSLNRTRNGITTLWFDIGLSNGRTNFPILKTLFHQLPKIILKLLQISKA